ARERVAHHAALSRAGQKRRERRRHRRGLHRGLHELARHLARGDDPEALRVVGELVRAVGGSPAVLGPLDRVRQLEEVAGFTIGLAFAGVDPNSAIPRLG
ncbi:MAG TPA: hypothetical protein VGF17_07395, partial [Phytomonospora sp.]